MRSITRTTPLVIALLASAFGFGLRLTPLPAHASTHGHRIVFRGARAVPSHTTRVTWVGGHNTEFDGAAPGQCAPLGGHNTEFDARHQMARVAGRAQV